MADSTVEAHIDSDTVIPEEIISSDLPKWHTVKWEYKRVLGYTLKGLTKTMDNYKGHLGEDGWELVQVVQGEENYCAVYKRPSTYREGWIAHLEQYRRSCAQWRKEHGNDKPQEE